jgi:glycosyltransferase involved in cell wall biosynthesis
LVSESSGLDRPGAFRGVSGLLRSELRSQVTVVLDATPLTMTSGGLPRYVSELSAALSVGFPADRFWLSSDQSFESKLPRLPGPGNWLERRWWLYGAERANERAGAALFHGTNFAVPYFARRPTVVTIHDLSPWLNPAWHFEAERVRKRTPAMLRLATMIVTPSEAVRREAMDRFRLKPERVVATPLAAAAIFQPVLRPAARPYFLFVGTLEPRKNIPMLLEAWRDVRRGQDVDLILAGRRRADGPEIKPETGLQVLGETPEEQLPQLYSNAAGVVYASEYEGFGLPVLEAMQCGAAVIISHDPALNEVAGGAALRVSSTEEMAAAMRTLCSDGAVRAAYSAKSLARARAYSWARTAAMTYEVYREAVARFGR